MRYGDRLGPGETGQDAKIALRLTPKAQKACRRGPLCSPSASGHLRAGKSVEDENDGEGML